MYERILVPIDGSDAASAAVDRALSLAELGDASLVFLSVVEPEPLLNAPQVPPSPSRDVLDEQTQDALDDAEAAAADAGVDCATAVESGVVHEVIGSYVDDEGVDLVAMGTHGRTGLDRLLIGSVTERTLRTSDVPVLTAREGAEAWRVDDVLVPTDGSDAAAGAVTHALEVAAACDATVHALSVVEVQTMAAGYHAGGALQTVIDSMKAQRESDVDAIRELAAERGLESRTTVVEGVPEHVIPEYAEDEGVDLVAMGTHGRTGLERAFVGSVAERTVRTSPAPVLAVPGSGE